MIDLTFDGRKVQEAESARAILGQVLDGVFITHSVMPDWVAAIARWLPLTFLADAMRAMVNSGETLVVQGASLLGLLVWAAIAFVLAVKAFRWE